MRKDISDLTQPVKVSSAAARTIVPVVALGIIEFPLLGIGVIGGIGGIEMIGRSTHAIRTWHRITLLRLNAAFVPRSGSWWIKGLRNEAPNARG